MALKDAKAKASKAYAHGKTNVTKVVDAASPYLSKRGSIIDAAKGNLFEFPVFISSSVDLEYATATSSLLEQVYASYLQAAISINPVIDASMVRTGNQFSAFKSDTNKYLECVDTIAMPYATAMDHQEFITEGANIQFDVLAIEDRDAIGIIEEYNKEPLSEFDHFFQESKKNEKRRKPNYEKSKQQILNGNSSTQTSAQTNQQQTQSDIGKAIQQQHKDQYDKQVLNSIRRNAENATKKLATQQKQNKSTIKQLEQAKKEVGELYKDYQTKMTAFVEKQKKFNEQSKQDHDELEEGRKNLKNDRDFRNTQARIDFEFRNRADNRDEIRLQLELDAAERAAKDSEKKLREYEDKHAAALDELGYDPKTGTTRADRNEIRQINNDNYKNQIAVPELIDENKIRKLNTLKPLMMNVQLAILSDDGNVSRPINYVIGVKTHNRIVDASVLPDVARYPMKEMDKISRKAKWRAGELKFFKDIVFKINEKKQTAIDSKDPRRKWYRRLYELSHMKGDAPALAIVNDEKIGLATLRSQITEEFSHGIIPNSTLVISKADVINIKSQVNIDLLDGSTAVDLCKELFLMGIVVIDIDEESIKMLLPDLHGEFEVQSLAAVNKQLAELDTSGTKTRDIFKALG